MRQSAAFILLWIYAGLVVYISLFPFEPWQLQGAKPWDFLHQPSTPFHGDGWSLAFLILGYMPIGALLTYLGLIAQRSRIFSAVISPLLAVLLAFCTEAAQSYLPKQVSSRFEWLLCVLGIYLGALLVILLDETQWLAVWKKMRTTYFVTPAPWILVLLLLWPVVFMGFSDTPFLPHFFGEDVRHWLEQPRHFLMQAYIVSKDVRISTSVGIGLLLPCLLAFSVVQDMSARSVAVLWVFVCALVATSIMHGIVSGWMDVFGWLNRFVVLGMGATILIVWVFFTLPRRICAGLFIVMFMVGACLFLQQPINEYQFYKTALWNYQLNIFHLLRPFVWFEMCWPWIALLLSVRYLFSSKVS